MIDRRSFAAILAGLVAAPRASWGQSPSIAASARTVFYASVGPVLRLYTIDFDAATLAERAQTILPANVQYAWPHPSARYFYVVSSNGEPGGGAAAKGDTHVASAFTVDSVTGVLAPHGEERRLPSRPIHISVDRAGEFILIAYNDPSNVTVHRLNGDGTIGDEIIQPVKPDTGIFGHQIRTTPGNRTAILVTRGNNATATKPEDPGALKLFGFDNGVLTNLASIAPGNGLGFGPRHLDFHPDNAFAFVSLERESKLYVYRLLADGTLSRDPLFRKDSLADPAHIRPGQAAGTIHVHPNGRFVYQANRNSLAEDVQGRKVLAGGENSIAVHAVDPATGEPTLIQSADGHGVELRTFALDPDARLLIAASIMPMDVRKDGGIETLAAGLTVYRIGADGRLNFARKYDVDTGKATQFWSGMVTLPA